MGLVNQWVSSYGRQKKEGRKGEEKKRRGRKGGGETKKEKIEEQAIVCASIEIIYNVIYVHGNMIAFYNFFSKKHI